MEVIDTQNGFEAGHNVLARRQTAAPAPDRDGQSTCRCRIQIRKHVTIYSIRKVFLPCLIRLAGEDAVTSIVG